MQIFCINLPTRFIIISSSLHHPFLFQTYFLIKIKNYTYIYIFPTVSSLLVTFQHHLIVMLNSNSKYNVLTYDYDEIPLFCLLKLLVEVYICFLLSVHDQWFHQNPRFQLKEKKILNG